MIVEGILSIQAGEHPSFIEQKLRTIVSEPGKEEKQEAQIIMARKKKHEEHENLERWLVSYADFVTLLFATFTALYAISQVDVIKFDKLAHSLKHCIWRRESRTYSTTGTAIFDGYGRRKQSI